MTTAPDSPLVTVVLPTYRRPRLLRRALRSLQRQSDPRWQALVCDNASGDTTAAVVAAMSREDPRIRYVCQPTNVGMEANFNSGAAQVDTPFFSFLCDDDLLLPRFLETAREGFAAQPDAGFSGGSVLVVSDDGLVRGAPLDAWPREGSFSPAETAPLFLGGDHPILTGLVFPRWVAERYPIFLPGLQISDLLLELRVAANHPIVLSRRPVALFVAHAGSSTTGGSVRYWQGQYGELAGILERDEALPAASRGSFAEVIRRRLRRSLFGLGLRGAVSGEPEEARFAAEILADDYGAAIAPRLLRGVASLSERVPPARRALGAARLAAKGLRERRRLARLRERYGSFREELALEPGEP